MGVDFSRLRPANARDRRPWHGSAFIVEALLLLVFLVASLAVIMQVIGGAHERGSEADHLSNAVVLASNDAEKFAAGPAEGDLSTTFALVDGMLVEAAPGDAEGAERYSVARTVQAHAEQAGTLYEAHIEVSSDGEVVYQVDTARYVPDGRARR